MPLTGVHNRARLDRKGAVSKTQVVMSGLRAGRPWPATRPQKDSVAAPSLISAIMALAPVITTPSSKSDCS